MNKTIAERIFRELLERSGSKVSVRIESRFPGGRNIGGKYCTGDHSVTMYLDEISKQCMKLFGSLEGCEQLLRIVFAHELGHAEDPCLPELCDRLDICQTEMERRWTKLRIEENAWDYARALVPDVNPKMLENVINCSLQAYREA